MYIMSVIVIAIGPLVLLVFLFATMAASVSLSGTGLGAYSHPSANSCNRSIDRYGPYMLERIWFPTNALVVDKIMGTIDKDAYNNPNEGRV